MKPRQSPEITGGILIDPDSGVAYFSLARVRYHLDRAGGSWPAAIFDALRAAEEIDRPEPVKLRDVLADQRPARLVRGSMLAKPSPKARLLAFVGRHPDLKR